MSYAGAYRSPAGNSVDSKRAFEALPQFYYTYRPERGPLAFGVGLYSPFGLSMKWPETTGFRSVALDGRVEYLTLSPVIAWEVFGPERGVHAASTSKVTASSEAVGGRELKWTEARAPFAPSLSIAFGPTLNFGKTELR